MARNKLFDALDLNHKPRRNGYDKSFNHKFTAHAGQLLCPMHMTTLPSGKYRIQVNHETLLPPVNTASRVRISEYFDFFFVPYRLLFRDSGHILTDNQQNPTLATSPYGNKRVGVDLPQISMERIWKHKIVGELDGTPGYVVKLVSKKNSFGLDRGALAAKHLSMLGYGHVDWNTFDQIYFGDGGVPEEPTPFVGQDRVSLFPLLAYQKIYYDFFRNSQWEDNQPYNYNVDYLGEDTFVDFDTVNASVYGDFWDNPTLFDVRYSNYPRDLFFGILPESQFGDAAVVEADGGFDTQLALAPSPIRFYETLDSVNPLGGEDGVVANAKTQSSGAMVEDTEVDLSSDNSSFYGEYIRDKYLKADNAEALRTVLTSLSTKFDILQLRKAQALQKYKEILGTGDYDYIDRIRKVFGIKVPDYLGEHCIYLGGTSNPVNIRPVTNQALEAGADAVMKGTAQGNGTTSVIDFEAKEHGVIMCIYHAQPQVDYNLNAFHFDVTKTTSDDFANPIFDQLGFQELSIQYLNISRQSSPLNFVGNNTNFLGYTTRYFDYKTSLDQTSGAWKESLKQEGWIAPLDMDYLQSFKVTDENNNQTFSLNMNFFKVNPHILDGVFAIDASDNWNTDQFRVDATFNIHAVLPLDYVGVPY